MLRTFLALALVLTPRTAFGQTVRRFGQVEVSLPTVGSEPDSLLAPAAKGAFVLAMAIDTNLALPAGGLVVKVLRCGAANAYYIREAREVQLCLELVTAVAQRARELRLGWGERELIDAIVFFGGHELGHALLHLYDIPVLGGEEAAADQFAYWFFGKIGWAQYQSRGAAYLLIFADSDSPGQGQSDYVSQLQQFGSLHPFVNQRYLNFACWLYGADSAGPPPPELPVQRASQCSREVEELESSWDRVLQGRLKPVTQQP